ncbi:hypothetical protein llg_33850 [Luteolibacter sp. LG18]|nr:hypothetical protein llg_33850 [Luteolibacter sp. LG18]
MSVQNSNPSPMPGVPKSATVAEAAVPDLPGPERAAAASARVKPALKLELAAKGLRAGDPVFIRIFKEERLLELWIRKRETRKYEFFRSWPVAAMSGELGPKLKEGDGQAPEGFYVVTPERMKPDSQFHLAFNIGFPNAYDEAHGRTGTFLMVHGNAVSIGCFAMTDPKIEEIYTLCADALAHGQPFIRVHSFPFRMTTERMAAAAGEPWEEFWKNLKEGYDRFETDRVPPNVRVEGKRYAFDP